MPWVEPDAGGGAMALDRGGEPGGEGSGCHRGFFAGVGVADAPEILAGAAGPVKVVAAFPPVDRERGGAG